MKHKVAVLGAGGMLGSMLLDVISNDKDFEVIATVRDKKEIVQFKSYKNVEFRELDVEFADIDVLKLALKDTDWVINAIGLIKPYIHDNNALEVERAVRINALFPHLLATAACRAKVIQIATDCVYSGGLGNYIESDSHDALDVYGKTKSIGEAHLNNMYNIRCSIVGPELTCHLSLLDWFLRQSRSAEVKGYKNHIWNGVTTLHFAKMCAGIIKNNVKINHLQHIVPADKVCKSDLLEIFAEEFDRTDIKIVSVNAPEVIDRTLATEKLKINKEIWRSAGYENIPTISQMIGELAKYIREKNQYIKGKNINREGRQQTKKK